MARAKNKAELIKSANENFNKMWDMVNTLTETQTVAKFNFGAEAGKEAHWGRDKNIRDILIHLYEWHTLLIEFINANMKGENKPFLTAPYTWKTYGEMNIEFWKKHQNTPYEKSKEMVKGSHKEVILLIEKFTDNELFEKAHFDWTGTTSLGQYCISATASHYDWAISKLKLHIKTMK
jgi:hypothetical protein